ncbi:MAG: VCBS repeat-containing protein [Syntrophaceae bacterium]|nr:VCBS repeat-containing protein [Syntrophaceae bacterium]
MRKAFIYILFLITLFTAAGSLWAKDKYAVTILPFSINSAENIDYVKNGIEEMLNSRISASDKIKVTPKSDVLKQLKTSKIKTITADNVHNIGKKLNSDFVVWGSITKIGTSVSIDGKLISMDKAKSDISVSSQSPSLDDVIPKINDFSESIVNHILGITPQVSATPTAPTAVTSPSVSRESQIIARMRTGGKKGGTLTSVINTEFINAAEPLNQRGFWMSQKIPAEFKGMDIGNVNNDKLNEVVTIDKNNVYIYQKTEKDLKLLEKIKGKSFDNYLAVDIADINGNGVPEIIVTSLNDTILDSFVLEFKDGKYEKIASDIRCFLRVIDTPSGISLLLGQEFGFGKPFDMPIYEMVWKGGTYVSDQKMSIPLGLSVYGLNIDNLGIGGNEKIMALDEYDYLYIIDKTTKPLSRLASIGFTSEELIWRSDDVYGGSNNYIENIDKNNPDDPRAKSAYVNLRILAADINKNGKKEIIIVKNLSSVGRMFKHYKLFTASEIYDLEWDGLGMSENWRTKKINGYVADYLFKDIDNDDQPELVLALVMSVGFTLRERSVIVVYDFDTPQQ